MPLNLASPGIVVREVDLTVGRIDPTSDAVGAIVAPFAKGPVDVPVLVENESDLLQNFGEPYSTDKHYEHWMVASSFLAYGGSLRVVRSDDTDLKNGFAGAASSIKIKSLDDYNNLGYDENTITDVTVAARNPGSWSNGVKVALIDAKADQILVGVSTSAGLPNIAVGYGVTQAISSTLPGAGTTSTLDGYLKGVITQISGTNAYVKVLSHVSAAGTETAVDYQPSGVYAFASSGTVAIHTAGQSVAAGSTSYTAQQDWFDQQTISLSNNTSITWNNIADRPSTSSFAAARNSRFDEVHVVVIDDKGIVSGNAGTILEKHLNLSKAKDAEFSVGSPSNWRKYLASNSQYIFGGSQPAGIVTTGFSSGFTLATDTGWDQETDSIIFGATGANTLTLAGGKNYNGGTDITASGSLTSTIGNLSTGYDLFANSEEYEVDFFLMGSANYAKESAQALANKLISVAEERKDAVAFISPHRLAFLNDSTVGSVTVNSAADITNNVISFYAPITSSSYSVFDSGYKYMYDKFADTFRYIPLNGDIAGVCARTDINNFPWFSPAGTTRGAILNAVKLAYNPSKTQRDRLYSNRINSVIFTPGSGIVLFGDKTGLAKASAFDRINVRRLFIYLENAISAAAKDQLFEFNDETTRSNFVNIVDPFLRDVQAKRGIQDFRVICDETNNTAAVIDNNEFVADIFIKPARSINFIGLTFVATRSGVSFEEIIGTV
jgi:phage tail sheath protein FI